MSKLLLVALLATSVTGFVPATAPRTASVALDAINRGKKAAPAPAPVKAGFSNPFAKKEPAAEAKPAKAAGKGVSLPSLEIPGIPNPFEVLFGASAPEVSSNVEIKVGKAGPP